MRLISRPGVWIWLISVMVLSGTGMTAMLVLAPPGQDLTMVWLGVLFAISALLAVPVSRTISSSMMPRAT
jgi:hypothetical protein